MNRAQLFIILWTLETHIRSGWNVRVAIQAPSRSAESINQVYPALLVIHSSACPQVVGLNPFLGLSPPPGLIARYVLHLIGTLILPAGTQRVPGRYR
ncbi:hypothetical protein DFH06DRAFT_1159720 [Mycena polygramma]|nr:hypothetical protein DFH06DRAFT_1159720 [Mycena polygramma]